MTDPKTLAERKVYLEARLRAIAMSNINGKTLTELTELELDTMNTIKELYEINAQIYEYTRIKS